LNDSQLLSDIPTSSHADDTKKRLNILQQVMKQQLEDAQRRQQGLLPVSVQ
jgi:hypothetical protein